MRLSHRLTALGLSLALIAGNAAVCAGWAATPEERMACCADGGTCPMHQGQSHGSESGRGLTQAEADTCCAASEQDSSTPSTPVVAPAMLLAVLDPGTLLPASAPALLVSDYWRTASPIPASTVPKHVLLSVFLV